MKKLGFDELVLSCGVARRLLRLSSSGQANAGTSAEPQAGSRLSLGGLDRLVALLSARSERERVVLDAGDEAADTLLPGAIVLRALLDGLGANDASIATTGLREGLVADYARTRVS